MLVGDYVPEDMGTAADDEPEANIDENTAALIEADRQGIKADRQVAEAAERERERSHEEAERWRAAEEAELGRSAAAEVERRRADAEAVAAHLKAQLAHDAASQMVLPEVSFRTPTLATSANWCPTSVSATAQAAELAAARAEIAVMQVSDFRKPCDDWYWLQNLPALCLGCLGVACRGTFEGSFTYSIGQLEGCLWGLLGGCGRGV